MQNNEKAGLPSILEQIVELRKKDLAAKGFSFGHDVPAKRTKPVVPFLPQNGVILEIKRASPSKGMIAPDLNAVEQAKVYKNAGAAAISILTEENYFKGSLEDLQNVAAAVPDIALLRKDFLLEEEEIETAYLCGADAVLLIARILPLEKMRSMLGVCKKLGIRALVEIRTDDDFEKLAVLAEEFAETIVAGSNARDLATFKIDFLQPLKMLLQMRNGTLCKYPQLQNVPLIFESGVRTGEAADFAASLGFNGMLLGEAAARSPQKAAEYVAAFMNASRKGVTPAANYWRNYTARLLQKSGKPFVKICGLTTATDAVLSAKSGADALGFIFCAKSKRCTNYSDVKQIVESLKNSDLVKMPELVAVITEKDSDEARQAFSLLDEKIVDVIQLHNCAGDFTYTELSRFAHYCALSADQAKSEEAFAEYDRLRHSGEPRILVDAFDASVPGGTGKTISCEMLQKFNKNGVLWLAGGISAQNVQELCKTFAPERMDLASGVESMPGKKDAAKIDNFFNNL